MKISVIIPVYNVEKYLFQCLSSIANQTYKDFEVIIVDDGSSDESINIINNFLNNDSRFKLIKTFHLGAANARNEGLKSASGDYVIFVDSDDYFSEFLLEKLLQNAIKFNSDITVCSSCKVNDLGQIIESQNPNSPINLYYTPINKIFSVLDFEDNIFSLLTPVVWNKLFKKELLIKNNITFPKLNIAEDVSFNYCAMVCAKSIYVINEELINYRYNRPKSHASYRADFASDIIKSYLILKDFLLKNNLKQYINATNKVYINHIRWEEALCNEVQYEKFLSDLKTILKDEWKIFQPALKKDYMTIGYLKKIIGEKKVMLWGASNFIINLLKDTDIKNIIGIIDNNKALQGKKIGNYKVFPPSILYEIIPDEVIMTIWQNNDDVYPIISKEIKEKYPKVKLAPNIFNED